MSRIALTNNQYADLIIAADENVGGIFPLPNGQYAQAVVPVDVDGNPVLQDLESPLYGVGGTGRWYNFATDNPGTSTVTLAINTLYFYPVIIRKSLTFDGIGVNVGTAGTGASPRLGIYGRDSNGLPSNLIIDSGTVDASTTGAKPLTMSNTTLKAGVYWLAILTNVACGITGYSGNPNFYPFFGSTTINTNVGVGFSKSQTYGALPNSLSSPFTVVTANPIIFLRTV